MFSRKNNNIKFEKSFLMKKENSAIAIISIVLGVIGALALFTYFLAVLGFLSVPGLILAIIARSKTKSGVTLSALIISSVSLVIFLAYVVMLNYSDYKSSHTVFEYYLPKKYSGWVLIKTGVRNAPPIPINSETSDDRYIIMVPDSGKIKTSSSMDGWHASKYFWYDEHDTIPFKPETGTWGEKDYKAFIHFETTSSDSVDYFYVSDIPRNPQDSVLLSCGGAPKFK